MSALRSVTLAVELASRQRDQFGRQLALAQRAHDFACSQLAQLSGYAGDTQSRWATGARVESTPEVLMHHGHFMSRLGQTLELQDRVVHDAAQRVAAARRDFLQAECRLAGLEKVLMKRKAEIKQRQARREQKVTDEFAAQQAARAGGQGRMQEDGHGD